MKKPSIAQVAFDFLQNGYSVQTISAHYGLEKIVVEDMLRCHFKRRPLKVLFWEDRRCTWLSQIVLWDGERTYWTDEMHASGGYEKINLNRWSKYGSRFILLGDL